jgi:HEAT repeat protein
MPRPFGGICRASLASICLLSTLVFGQAAQDSKGSASNLVEQFKKAPVFWPQFLVAKKIVALGDKSVLQGLEPELSSEDMHRRGNAAFIFASLGDDRGFQIIKAILEGHARYAVNDLRKSDPREQIRWDRYSAEDRYYAVHLFGDLKDARAVPILVPLLKDKEVNSIVPWSLGQIGDKSAIPPLIQILDDKSPDMRALAIYGLEQLDAKEALPKLRVLLTDDETIHFDGLGPVSDAARKAIDKLEQKR